MTRPLTIIESPYAPSEEHKLDAHLVYLAKCLRDSWDRGELPFASHAFFPFFLSDSNDEERKAGIEAGYQFWDMYECGPSALQVPAPTIAFYTDFGISPGMKQALDRATKLGYTTEMRTINHTKEKA